MPAARIIGHMVTFNELDRWLTHTLPWLQAITDSVVVYDDRSTDATVQFVTERGGTVTSRPSSGISFIEDESAFRAAAWSFLVDATNPQPGDWILSIDADEFLVSTTPEAIPAAAVRYRLRQTMAEQRASESGVTFPVLEVFECLGRGRPVLVRVDGYWANITARRFMPWHRAATFGPRVEGGGSLPSSGRTQPRESEDLRIMHFGYVRAEDRYARFERYRSGRGHNLAHVNSILAHPRLERWVGMVPPLAPS